MKIKNQKIDRSLIRLFSLTNKRLTFIGLGILISKKVILTNKLTETQLGTDKKEKGLSQEDQLFIDFPFIEPNQIIKVNQLNQKSINNQFDLFKISQNTPKTAKICNNSKRANKNINDAMAFFARDGNLKSIIVEFDIPLVDNLSNLKISESSKKFEQYCEQAPFLLFSQNDNKLLGIIESDKNESGIILKLKRFKIFRISILKDIFKDFFFHFSQNFTLRQIFGLLIGLLSIFANVFGVIAYMHPTYLSPMGADINIVVLPFAKQNCNGSEVEKIDRIIPTQISTILKENSKNFDVEVGVRDPSIYPILPLRFSELTAEKAAKDNNAQMVIYGKITCQKNNDALVQTKVYISTENFGDALELVGENIAGQYDFSQFMIYGGDRFAGNAFTAQQKDLQDKIQIFSMLIYGLGSFSNQDSTSAIQYYEKALDPNLWTNKQGQETIYILLGNVYLRKTTGLFNQGLYDEVVPMLDTSEQYFSQADAISISNNNGSYARALIGMSGVYQLRSVMEAIKFNDLKMINIDYLQKSNQYLQDASRCKNSPVTADINEKVNYGYAQISFIKYLINHDESQLLIAENFYNEIIKEYHNGQNLRISEIVALSLKGKAVIYKNTDINKAEVFLKEAYSVARNRSLKAQILVQEGDLYLDSNKIDLAVQKYREALQMKTYLEKVINQSELTRIEEFVSTYNAGSIK